MLYSDAPLSFLTYSDAIPLVPTNEALGTDQGITFSGSGTLSVNQKLFVEGIVTITFGGVGHLRVAGKAVTFDAVPDSYTFRADAPEYAFTADTARFTFIGSS